MNEYISKKEVLDYLNGYLHSLGYDNTDLIVNGQRHALINVLEDILTVKAADVQPVKHGKWEYYKNNGIFDTHKCTLCGEKYEMYMDIEPTTIYKYCPNCGARMDGDTNE